MAGHLLSSFGAHVTKWEDETFGDPFKDGLFKQMDPSFSQWYDELNSSKTIEKVNFKADGFSSQLKEKILSSEIVIMGLPPKLQKKFGVTKEELEKEKNPLVVLEMTASHHEQKGLHDLNILAMKNLLHLHVRDASREKRLAPPFLPVAGIGYGSYLALGALSFYQQALKEKRLVHKALSLEDSVDIIYSPFYSKTLQDSGQDTFLHNGRYPCYALYPLQDKGWLAVASLEEKYWQRFVEALKLELSNEERFYRKDERVFQLLEEKIAQIPYEQALNIFSGLDACVTPTL